MPRSRSLCWPAAWLLLAFLGVARPVMAAGGPVVIDELFIRCLDGSSTAAYLELRALVPGQVFDSTLRVRILGPSGGVLADLALPVGSRQGAPWAVDQRLLVATPGFLDVTQVSPDGLLPASPSAVGGQVQLYRRIGTGSSIQILDRVAYSTTGTNRTPPAGRSLVRRDSLQYVPSSEPSPTTADGVLARAPGCFAPPQRAFVIQELSTQCVGADPAGAFIEVAGKDSQQSLDGDLVLRVFNASGVLRRRIPLAFEGREGQAFPTNRSWLLGPADLLSGIGAPPDQVTDLALDVSGGLVQLLGSDATGQEVILDEFVYGSFLGTTTRPAPGPGESYVWSPFTRDWRLTSPMSPSDLQGTPHVAYGCPVAPQIRIDEVLLACALTGSADRAIELMSLSNEAKRDTALYLAFRDRNGIPNGQVHLDFGARAGQPWPLNTTWLVATAGISNLSGSLPDQPLPLALDRIGGTVDLLFNTPVGFVTLQRLTWGTSGFGAPPDGQSLQCFSPTDYRLRTVPGLTRADGVALGCPSPSDTALLAPASFGEIVFACFDGDRRSQYVRLDLNTAATLDSVWTLEMIDHLGVTIGGLPRCFGTRTGQRAALSPSRTFLFGTPNDPLGAQADGILPAELDRQGGTLQLRYEGPRGTRIVQLRSYSAQEVPPDGQAIRFLSLSDAGRTATPAPTRFDGTSYPLDGCVYGASAGGELTALMTRCADGSTALQFLQWSPRRPSAKRDPTLGLRVLDGFDREVARFSNLFAGTAAFVDMPATQLIASDGFEAASGLAPDRVLPARIPDRGTVEMFWTDPLSHVQTSLSRVSYEALLPAAGVVVQRTIGGTLGFMREPRARRSDGAEFAIPEGCLSEPSPMRIEQIVFGCHDGDARGQQFMLGVSTPGMVLDSSYTLRVRDHAGVVSDSVPALFASQRGVVPARSAKFLVAAPGRPALAGAPDAVLNAPLDPAGCEIELLRHVGGVAKVLWTEHFAAFTGLVPPGLALGLSDSAAHTVMRPGMQNFAGARADLPGCHLSTGLWKPTIAQIFTACGDGDGAAQHIAIQTRSGDFKQPGLGLRITGPGLTVPIDLLDLTPSAAFEPWPPAASVVLAPSSLATAVGIAPDVILNKVDLTRQPVTLTLFQRTPVVGEAILQTATLTPGLAPRPGLALVDVAGALSSAPARPVVRLDGATGTVPTGCTAQVGAATAFLREFMLECRGVRGVQGQYVIVGRRDVYTARDLTLHVRAFDHTGAPRGEPVRVFSPAGGPYWSSDQMLLGLAEFPNIWEIPADITLPVAMDPTGGRIELVLLPGTAERILDQVTYGTPALPVPEKGLALARSSVLDPWTVVQTPRPRSSTTIATPAPLCGGSCLPSRYRLSFGPFIESASEFLDDSNFATRVRFDHRAGEWQIESGFSQASLSYQEVMRLTGTGEGLDTLDAALDLLVTRQDTCILGRCYPAVARVRVFLDEQLVDSLKTSPDGRATLHWPMSMPRTGSRSFRIEAVAEGVLSYQRFAQIDARLRFARVPAGTDLVGCHGYSALESRFVDPPEVTRSLKALGLRWHMARLVGTPVSIERRQPAVSSEWRVLEQRTVPEDGSLELIDREVEPGSSYGYRVTWNDRFGPQVSDVTTVETLIRPVYGYFGPRPNPSSGELSVSFELPEAGEVSAEWFDVTGRRVGSVVRFMPAGAGRLQLVPRPALAPGVYRVRFRAQGREERGAVVLLK